MSELKLTELIDPKTLQEIQDGFSDVTGMAALTTDADGTPVTEGSNFTRFCMEIVRKSGKGCTRCEECDRKGGETTQATGKATAYVCHAGLMDFAAPIVVNGEMVGSFIGGQVMIEVPDEAHFAEIAEDIEVPSEDLISAVREVPIVSREKVETAVAFLQTISGVLSSMAFTSYNTNSMNAALVESIQNTSTVIDEVRAVAEQAQMTVREMETRFTEVSQMAETCRSEVDSCGGIVKAIQENARTTHILGLNASIEAARAKEQGRGFGVIASEVRELADMSRSSADVIKEKISEIGTRTREMSARTGDAQQLVDACLKEIDKLKEVIIKLQKTESYY